MRRTHRLSERPLATRVPRAHERVRVVLPCLSSTAPGAWSTGVIENLSTHGFGIQRPAGAKVGAHIKVRLPGLEMMTATIRWVKNERVGCALSRPLSSCVFEHVVGQARA